MAYLRWSYSNWYVFDCGDGLECWHCLIVPFYWHKLSYDEAWKLVKETKEPLKALKEKFINEVKEAFKGKVTKSIVKGYNREKKRFETEKIELSEESKKEILEKFENLPDTEWKELLLAIERFVEDSFDEKGNYIW